MSLRAYMEKQSAVKAAPRWLRCRMECDNSDFGIRKITENHGNKFPSQSRKSGKTLCTESGQKPLSPASLGFPPMSVQCPFSLSANSLSGSIRVTPQGRVSGALFPAVDAVGGAGPPTPALHSAPAAVPMPQTTPSEKEEERGD